MSLGPALAKPEEASALFVDHVALALSAHIARVYGGMPVARYPPRGGLAPWRERRAYELLNAQLGREIPPDALSVQSGVCALHFTPAFPHATAVGPPHSAP